MLEKKDSWSVCVNERMLKWKREITGNWGMTWERCHMSRINDRWFQCLHPKDEHRDKSRKKQMSILRKISALFSCRLSCGQVWLKFTWKLQVTSHLPERNCLRFIYFEGINSSDRHSPSFAPFILCLVGASKLRSSHLSAIGGEQRIYITANMGGNGAILVWQKIPSVKRIWIVTDVLHAACTLLIISCYPSLFLCILFLEHSRLLINTTFKAKKKWRDRETEAE